MAPIAEMKEDSPKKGLSMRFRALSPGRTREPQVDGADDVTRSSGTKDKGNKDKKDKSSPGKTWMGAMVLYSFLNRKER